MREERDAWNRNVGALRRTARLGHGSVDLAPSSRYRVVMPPSDLSQATQVSPLAHAPGWYIADLPEDWSYVTPSGGVLMTIAMRAMMAELSDPTLAPVSATTLFCSSVPAGPMEIRVEVLRRGNAAAQLRAALTSTAMPGPGLEVSATFTRQRQGPDVHGIEAPEVPLPEDCLDADDRASSSARAPRRWPFFDNLDIRLAVGEPMWRPGWTGGEARTAFWYRYRVPQLLGACLDPLALPPIADTMPSALTRRLGPEQPRFYAPSLDLTVHFLEPSKTEWHLVDARCQRARGGYATADADIWNGEGKLVARATQTMMLRRVP